MTSAQPRRPKESETMSEPTAEQIHRAFHNAYTFPEPLDLYVTSPIWAAMATELRARSADMEAGIRGLAYELQADIDKCPPTTQWGDHGKRWALTGCRDRLRALLNAAPAGGAECQGCVCQSEHDGDYGASGHPGSCPPHTCALDAPSEVPHD